MKRQIQFYLYIPLLCVMLFTACGSEEKKDQSEGAEEVAITNSSGYLPPFMSREDKTIEKYPQNYISIDALSNDNFGINTYEVYSLPPFNRKIGKGIYFYGFKVVVAEEIRMETTGSGYSYYAKRRDDSPEIEVLKIDKKLGKIYCRNYNTFNPDEPMKEISKSMVDDRILRHTKKDNKNE